MNQEPEYHVNSKGMVVPGWFHQMDHRKKVFMVKLPIGIMLVLLGILCIVFPEQLYLWLPLIGGLLMVVSGVFRIALGIRHKEYKSAETKLTTNGIVSTVLGIVVLYKWHEAYGLLGAMWGFSGLLRAIRELNEAIHLITTKRSGWIRVLVVSIFGIIVAILLLINPAERVLEHMIFIGIELIIMGYDQLEESYEVMKKKPVKKGKGNKKKKNPEKKTHDGTEEIGVINENYVEQIGDDGL